MVKVAPLPEYRGKRDWSKLGLDVEKAGKILPPLAEMYRRRQGIFAGAKPPQKTFFPRHLLEQEHEDREKLIALWVFYIMHFMRGPVNSSTVTDGMSSFHREHPEFFRPEYVVKYLTPESIYGAFGRSQKAGSLLIQGRDHAKSWYENSVVLLEHFEGNPLNIWGTEMDFYRIWRKVDPDYDRRITCFRGKRKKIFTLETMWLQGLGLIQKFPIPLPIDVHALRILFQTEIMPYNLLRPLEVGKQPRKKPYPKEVIGRHVWRVKEIIRDQVSDFLYHFCVSYKVDPSDLSHALWFLSRMLCARHAEAGTEGGEKPVYRFPEELEKDPSLWPKRDPCRFCVLEPHCHFVVPTQPHLWWGLIMPLRRVPHPASSLAFEEMKKMPIFLNGKRKEEKV